MVQSIGSGGRGKLLSPPVSFNASSTFPLSGPRYLQGVSCHERGHWAGSGEQSPQLAKSRACTTSS